MPLWGEAVSGAEREDYVATAQYDVENDEFNPSADTESALLREAIELARTALLSIDRTG